MMRKLPVWSNWLAELMAQMEFRQGLMPQEDRINHHETDEQNQGDNPEKR